MVFFALSVFIKEWQSWLNHTRRLSPHTVEAYTSDFFAFLTFTQNHKGEPLTLESLVDLSLKDFRSWLAYRQEKDYTSRSTARALCVLRNFFRFLAKQNGSTNKAILGVRSPRLPISLPKPLTRSEALTFMEEISQISSKPWLASRDKALFSLLYGCGLRINEALSLNQGCWPLGETVKIKGKGAKERMVPVLPQTKEDIAAYLALCPYKRERDDPLFYGVRGKRLRAESAQQIMRSYRKLIGLPPSATPHALRHSFATHLMDATGDIRSIQDLLGHSSLSTTQIYTKVETHKLLEVFQAAHPHGKKNR